jgi:leucyl aminopeptidase
MATLTGAIVRALNDEYAGLFSREDIWRLPLHKNYLNAMKSDTAEIKNVVEGGGLGAGLGATFVGFFVSKNVPWAHLDTAGVN